MGTKSSRSRRASKSVAKPYTGFPLTIRPDGRLIKKHRQRQHYFGTMANWQAAVEKYNHDWPYILQGRVPPPIDTGEGCTVQLLINLFLTAKKTLLDAGELSPRTFTTYYATCEHLTTVGKTRRVDSLTADDFRRLRSRLADQYGVVAVKNMVNNIRIVLKFAWDEGLIDKPIRYGQAFNRPSMKMLRKARNEAGVRMFEAAEIRRMLDAADPVMKAMILLSVNGGLGNTDLSRLPQTAIDFDAGWLNYPRPKTEIPRRIPLWPETVAALREAIVQRSKPAHREDDDLCFLTARGARWVRVQPAKKDPDKLVAKDSLSAAFGRLMKSLGINGDRGFYCFRRTFETIAGESKDQVAVDAVMGHVDSSMAATYRQRISDDRLRVVVGVVRNWLWPDANVEK